MIKKFTSFFIWMIVVLMFIPTYGISIPGCSTDTSFVDFDIDSDNNNGVQFPDRSSTEDTLETTTPKIITVNDDDDDRNGILDFNQDGPIASEFGELIPVILELGTKPSNQTIHYQFVFSTTYMRIWSSPQRGSFSTAITSNQWYTKQTKFLGDMNLDGLLNNGDIDPFNLALQNIAQYRQQYGIDPVSVGDMNGDGVFDGSDEDPFLTALSNALFGNCFSYVHLVLWIEGLENSSGAVPIAVFVDLNGDSIPDTNDSVMVTVRDKTHMIITTPPSVQEGNTFTVTVIKEQKPTDKAVAGVSVTFIGETKTTDSNGRVSFTAPQVSQDAEYRVFASKETFSLATASIMVLDVPPLPLLHIIGSPTVIENNEFLITITNADTGMVVSSVAVTFNGQTYYTDDAGQTTCTAPNVTTNTPYFITADYEGYLSDTVTVTVLNEREEPHGWIFGQVITEDGSSLSDVAVCCTPQTNDGTSTCVYTAEDGTFIGTLTPGEYTITASISGYQPKTQITILPENTANQINFIFEPTQTPSSQEVDTTTSAIDYFIKKAGDKIGGRVDFTRGINGLVAKTISQYSDFFSMEVNSSQDAVSFTVSAPNGTTGTIFVIRIGEGVLSDLDNLNVTYDNVSIMEEQDIAAFFDIQDHPTPAWVRVLTTTGLYIFVRVPHFSTHTITISSLIEFLDVIPIILWYFLGSMIVVLLFSSTIVAHYVQYGKRIRKVK